MNITTWEARYWNREQQDGAVDFSECPRGGYHCRCEKCGVCGYPKHTAIHAPFIDQPPGSKPYGHRFEEPQR